MSTTKTQIKKEQRERRHKRVRSQVKGTTLRPRLSVFKSNKYITAQLIDDENGNTIVAFSSKNSKAKATKEKAKEVGTEIAKQAKAKKISEAVFDRGGFLYTGNIKAVAEGAREGGLKF